MWIVFGHGSRPQDFPAGLKILFSSASLNVELPRRPQDFQVAKRVEGIAV
jgi:hypothetical protein